MPFKCIIHIEKFFIHFYLFIFFSVTYYLNFRVSGWEEFFFYIRNWSPVNFVIKIWKFYSINDLKKKGIRMECDTGKNLADSLDRAHDKENPFFNTMLRMLTTRCMMQALYFCSGLFPEAEFKHYGLAAGEWSMTI